MPTTILKAHYDGQQIVLDEPHVLAAGTPLAVAVLVDADSLMAAERSEWYALGAQSLARAYGDDEPDYTVADLKK